ncbi:TPA: hypothetical protein ACGE6H_003533, partial [Serratia marcescens]
TIHPTARTAAVFTITTTHNSSPVEIAHKYCMHIQFLARIKGVYKSLTQLVVVLYIKQNREEVWGEWGLRANGTKTYVK